ncbi:alcohol dehydrogenase [Gregarina niphandrodes]|uniref:Alcohol dehydrogenase n=1 Tax=Gregarina niphandrodes TaxID=110365 RepID=A0A023BBF3_GRENI|nr:alcohol dehydrogenase [Gregarina niphandrodes]EZG79195.1 alcohol dehydrogenase [Gregarina niphandrodes]|eukprot:XP_011129110.1 alcohol dehydrogenase [Gregarina niphandrodes]
MANVDRVPNVGYAAMNTKGVLVPWKYTIRHPLEDELLVRVLYCGICHTDIHMAENDWHTTRYPCVPGHEFIGVIEMAGRSELEQIDGPSSEPGFEKGDYVGIGFMCDSCLECESCLDDRQMHCDKQVDTFSGFTRGEVTYGGYGKFVVIRKAFAVKIPKDTKPEILRDMAPLMCAGITTYAPIVSNHMSRGNLRIGVIGLGGLGHLAVQFAAKINPTNEVYVISRSKNKEQLAKQLGALGMIQVGSDPEKNDGVMKEYGNRFDYLLDTVAVSGKPLAEYMRLLKPLGTLITVGLPPVDEIIPMPVTALVMKNCSIQGSLVGGIKLTQNMIDFCHEHSITPMCEHVKLSQVNEAFQRVLKSDVLFRFVIDVADSIDSV